MAETLTEALDRATHHLAPHPDAAADARELLSRALGVTLVDLALDRRRVLSADEHARLDAWLRRRAAGEPVQYVTGRAVFRELDLAVDPRVLIPRPETEGLVQAVLTALASGPASRRAPRVLDLGTGSGAIALSIACEWPAASVLATDVSADALDVARANAATLGLLERVRFAFGDGFGAVDPDERFEVVVSNPPYIALDEAGLLPTDVRDHEPDLALFGGDDGLDLIRTILEDAPRHLVAGGLLALELAEQRAELVAEWLHGASAWRDVQLCNDLAGRPRVLLAHRELGPAIAPLQWGEHP